MIRHSSMRSIGIVLIALTIPINAIAGTMVWPPHPDEPRIEYVGEILCKDLHAGSGFFSKITSFISGRNQDDLIRLPYDVIVVKNKMYLTCQGIPYLIEIDMSDNSFRKHHDKKNPFGFPLCLCLGNDGTIFITDGDTRSVFEFRDGEVRPFITDGLSRPTGITANVEKERLYIVDTGDHDLKIYDFDGKLIRTVSEDLTTVDKFHFPTHVATTVDNNILVNDALNYRIKRFDSDGHLISSFGEEGDGPGTFSRPKGVASDSEGNVYVIDNLFDNLQVFDSTGRFLLVIGSVGSQIGQFYSPSGVAITNDTIYIADTYNDRIQILHFLGCPK